MNLLTAKKVVEFFNDFVTSEDTRVVSLPGFYKYLVMTKKFDPSMLRDVKDRFKSDPEIFGYVNSVCEGHLVEGGLLGTLHASMSQFVLKHKHGYVDIDSESSMSNSSVVVEIQ